MVHNRLSMMSFQALIVCLSLGINHLFATGQNPHEVRCLKKPDHSIHSLFVKRQSSYALDRTHSAKQMANHLETLFEAARWAPSSYNNQPWRYIYGIFGTTSWDRLMSLLVPFNQEWTSQAGALILVISKNTFDSGKPAPTHSFDTGLASAQLILQATHMGLVAHGMSGFDSDKARKLFAIPADYTVEAMIAIGQPAAKGKSRKEFVERDAKPAVRKKLSEITGDGAFPTGS